MAPIGACGWGGLRCHGEIGDNDFGFWPDAPGPSNPGQPRCVAASLAAADESISIDIGARETSAVHATTVHVRRARLHARTSWPRRELLRRGATTASERKAWVGYDDPNAADVQGTLPLPARRGSCRDGVPAVTRHGNLGDDSRPDAERATRRNRQTAGGCRVSARAASIADCGALRSRPASVRKAPERADKARRRSPSRSMQRAGSPRA
jgi:hypothetical protein